MIRAAARGQDLSLPVSAACLRKDHCAISLSSSSRMKGADSFEAIPLLRLQEVVLQGSVTVWIASKSGNRADYIQMVYPVLITGQIDPLDAVNGLSSIVQILSVQNTSPHTLEIEVCEH